MEKLEKRKAIIDILLSDIEKKMMEDATEKQLEMYVMQKLIHQFKRWEMGTKTECFAYINDFRKDIGYGAWKSWSSMSRLWDKDFFDIGVMPISLDDYYKFKNIYAGGN